jgi:nucleoside-diphosphate-sugar epimerase
VQKRGADIYLITGATGFIGSALINRLITDELLPVAAVRRDNSHWPAKCPVVEVGDLEPNTDWSVALIGIRFVIHAAARVHVMRDQSADPLAEFRRVNVAGTLNLAQQAAAAGVKRFIFVSSVKVNGEQTKIGRPFTEKDRTAPVDAYGISKYEAEVGLQHIAKETGMEVVIIRPVLVYGPGVKGNFLSMMHWLHKGIPLPFGAVNNSRSLVALDNLVDLIITCLHHRAAANQTFLVSDGDDISTTQLLQYTASAMGVSSRLIPVPVLVIQVAAKLLRKSEVAQRLCGNLQVDVSKACQLLGWVPPISVKEGLRRAAEGHVQSGGVLK